MKTIEVIVHPDGSTKIETKGFTGADCLEASRQLEESLGAVVSDRPTAERYQQHPQRQQAREGG